MIQQSTAAWRRTALDAGVGLVRVLRTAAGFVADGCEVAVKGSTRWSCRFTLGLDGAWRTRALRVEVSAGSALGRLRLDADGAGRWWRDGTALPALDGCLDVDLAATAFTTPVPLQRLRLQAGQAQRVTVARVDVPALLVERRDQQFARLGPAGGLDRYDYWLSSFSDPRRLTI